MSRLANKPLILPAKVEVTVDGSNTTFTFTAAPSAIVVDGVVFQQTEQGGTVNWTGTTTVVLAVPPVNSIFSII